VIEYLTRLRSWPLFIVTTTLFLIDVLVPDPVPFLDELFLGLVAALLSRWKKRGS